MSGTNEGGIGGAPHRYRSDNAVLTSFPLASYTEVVPPP